MSNSPTSQASAGHQAAATNNWPTFSDDPFPSNANVILGFTGLMCFCHRHKHPDKKCEIGIHNQSPDHELKITVFSVSPKFNPPDPGHMDMRPFSVYRGPFNINDTGNTMSDRVTFVVNNPSLTDVLYFQKGGPHDDPRNFRNITDFESDDFYGQVELSKNFENMGPRVLVEHARFYTLCLSNTAFDREDDVPQGGNSHPIGRIARMIGANIYLGDGGSVKMYIEGLPQPVEMNQEDGKFFVLIDNSCPPSICTDSDFPLYRQDIFDRPPSSQVDFKLIKNTTSIGNPIPGSPCVEFLPDKLQTQPSEEEDDETPCAPGGFGTCGGMP